MKENINTQKIPTKRNLSIEMVKLFFAISIALGHYSAPIIDSRIVVFLFFVLSGYFLVGSFDSNKYNNSWQYTLNRIKSIYPYYDVTPKS